MQEFRQPAVIDSDFALDHGDARSFQTPTDAENGAFDGHQGIGGGYFEMAAALLGGFHQDAAARQANGFPGPAFAEFQIAAFVHFDAGSVAQTDHGTRAFARADFLAFGD